MPETEAPPARREILIFPGKIMRPMRRHPIAKADADGRETVLFCRRTAKRVEQHKNSGVPEKRGAPPLLFTFRRGAPPGDDGAPDFT